ncbi:helix-turn-helix transcriptional regulator [Streptomyces sp. CB03911]|uniref:helix-turn-helix domain-containing protein n=1 Tax=Streptomyces sp. CB03911 TaxID=1804758 RepID=UPI00095AD107|nr:helix-turn-helix transcriptional regulator [Streptomyces sp. CB03911]OKI16538.1 hypothetical protein A6A07_11040 [Streptomyces sp. CB03911]
MSKPLAPHGTYARFLGRPAANIAGCRCDDCTLEGRRYYMRRDYLASTGRPLTVSAEATREHLKSLFAAGAGWTQLVAVSGSSSSTISGILSGRQATVRRSTEQKLLRIRAEQVRPEVRSMPSVGAVRRLRALTALGHTSRRLAAATGMSHSLMTALLGGTLQQVRPQTHDAICTAFKQLAMVPGSSRATATRAIAKGWAPPLAWDDDLDDPKARPAAGSVRRIRSAA